MYGSVRGVARKGHSYRDNLLTIGAGFVKTVPKTFSLFLIPHLTPFPHRMVLLWGLIRRYTNPLRPPRDCRGHGISAQGHIHRSLGCSPRDQMETSILWPKAILNVSRLPRVNMAFGEQGPDSARITGRCPMPRWKHAFGQARIDSRSHNFRTRESRGGDALAVEVFDFGVGVAAGVPAAALVVEVEEALELFPVDHFAGRRPGLDRAGVDFVRQRVVFAGQTQAVVDQPRETVDVVGFFQQFAPAWLSLPVTAE